MDNMYSAEDAIICAVSGLVSDGLVYTELNLPELDKETFKAIEDEAKRVAIVVLNAGYKVKSVRSAKSRRIVNVADGVVQKKTSSLIQSQWRVLVVTPSELYKSIAGVKLMQVISALQGLVVDDQGKTLEIIDDVREFNEPDFVANLFSIPSVFGFDVIV